MKRLLTIVAVSFIFFASAFASEATKLDPAEPLAMAAKSMGKETKMSATGKVTEISDSMLKIDRHVKGKTEAMEFALEKACPDISTGDKVKVSYIAREDKKVASKVTKIAQKAKKHHAKKKTAAKEEVKPAEEPAKAAE